MLLDDLGARLRDSEGWPAPLPDLAAIRARGRRRQRLRRIAVASVSASVLAALALGVAGVADRLSGGSEGGTVEIGVAHQPGARTLSTYERRVLRTVPGSYAVGGVVVVPGPLDTSKKGMASLHRFRPSELPSPIVSLGRDGFTQPGYLGSADRYPRFMQGNPPKHSQVVADNGPVSLTCTRWEGHRPCGVSVVVGSAERGWFYLYGLGSDSFLEPSAPMQVFLDDSYDGRVLHQAVIGGFDGAATRVRLTLTNGSWQDASLDSGRISRGDTLFWADVRGLVASVTAYDDAGEVVARHRVRACSGGVDCEVR